MKYITCRFTVGISYLLVYRGEDYKRAIAKVKELDAKVKKEKDMIVSIDKRKAHEKKVQRLEEELKFANQAMSGPKFKLNIFVSLSYMVAYYHLSNYVYRSAVIAQVPFVPVGLFKAFVRRGLATENVQHAGFGFLYTLTSMSLKVTITKALGFAPPRTEYSVWDEQKKKSEKYAEKYA
mmetsp:Transcript_11357/g.19431  ORF Transcript_11357/g.19431 Transcript_11357/m.19431 type:complete len:179 (+) Transcript_11357:246-782(+)